VAGDLASSDGESEEERLARKRDQLLDDD